MPPSNLNHCAVAPLPATSPGASPLAIHRDNAPIEGGFDPKYGNVTWQTLICNSRMESRDLVLGTAHIPAHGNLPLHRHDPAEFYYITAGDGEVTIDGQILLVFPGMAVFIPGGTEHGIQAGLNGIEFLYGFPKNRFDDVSYVFTQQQDAEQ